MGRKLGRPPSDALQRVLDAYGVDRLDLLAERMQLPYGTVRNWHTRDSIPLAHVLLVERETGISRSWIETGQGDRYAGRLPPGGGGLEVQEARPAHPLASGVTPRVFPAEMLVALTGDTLPLVLSVSSAQGRKREYHVIPKIQGQASAGRAERGGDAMARMVDLGGDMAFTTEWLKRQIGPKHGQLVSINVSGDSMAPTILDGETVIIDTEDRKVSVSGIYVIAPHDRYQLKRIHLRLDGSLKVMSDNPAYEPETLASNQVEGLHVVGRMVWPRLR